MRGKPPPGASGSCWAEFHEAYTAGREFLVPDEVVRRELAGESPIKLWREHRGLTQQELAKRVGISKPYLSQIETGKRQGTVETLSALARALEVPLDVLTDWGTCTLAAEKPAAPGTVMRTN